MTRKIVFLTVPALILTGMGIASFLSEKLSGSPKKVEGSLYDFEIKALDGTPISFSQYKGKNRGP